jgi:hypothetical protein
VSGRAEQVSGGFSMALQEFAEIDCSGVSLTPESLTFCVRNNLLPRLETAIKLARRHFSAVATMSLCLEQDPENSDEYLVLELRSNGVPEADLESYFRYVDEWSEMAEWPVSRMIRLDYSTITLDPNRRLQRFS